MIRVALVSLSLFVIGFSQVPLAARAVETVQELNSHQLRLELREQIDRSAESWAKDLLRVDRSVRGRLMSAWAWSALTGSGALAIFDFESSEFDGFAMHSELSRALRGSTAFMRAVVDLCRQYQLGPERECANRLIVNIKRSQLVGTLTGTTYTFATLGLGVGIIYKKWFADWFRSRVSKRIPRFIKQPVFIWSSMGALTAGSIAWSMKVNADYNKAVQNSAEDFVAALEELEKKRPEREQESLVRIQHEKLAHLTLSAFEWIREQHNNRLLLNSNARIEDLDLTALPGRVEILRLRSELKDYLEVLTQQFADTQRVTEANSIERRIADAQLREGDRYLGSLSVVRPDELKLWLDYQVYLSLNVLLPLLAQYTERAQVKLQ